MRHPLLLCFGMNFLIQIGNSLDSLDAQSGIIRYGDALFLKYSSSQDRILAAEHRSIQIDLGDHLSCTGQVNSRIYADFCLQHSADHTLSAAELSYRCDLKSIVETAAFHQFDVYHVGGACLKDVQGVCRRVYDFVCHDRNIGDRKSVV